MSSEEDVFSFITVLGLAVFIGLCILLIVLIATSAIILVIYVIIDCLLRPFLGTCLDLDLEIGGGQQQRARIVTYHAIIPTNLRLTNEIRDQGKRRGLRQNAIDALLPKLLVGQGKNEVDKDRCVVVESGGECAICLSGYVVDEECRVFPVCRHMYHALCIDAWLKNHLTCPTCRKGLLDS